MYSSYILIGLLACLEVVDGRFVQGQKGQLTLDQIDDLMVMDRKKRDAGIHGSGLKNAGGDFETFHDDVESKRGHTGSGLRNANDEKQDPIAKKWVKELSDIKNELLEVKNEVKKFKDAKQRKRDAAHARHFSFDDYKVKKGKKLKNDLKSLDEDLMSLKNDLF